MASNNKKWIIAGCGCLTLVALVGVGVMFWLRQQVKSLEEGFTNPEKKVLSLLNAETLPAGYHAQMALSIPFIMDILIISNEEKVEEKEPNMGSDGLLYMKFIASDKDLVDYMEGRTDDAKALRDSNINIDAEDVIGRGSFEMDGQQFLYAVQRGSIQMDRGRTRGLSTLFLIQCGTEKKMRLGIRYGPDPDVSAPVEALDLTGTVGDIDQLKSFLANFQFCQ